MYHLESLSMTNSTAMCRTLHVLFHKIAQIYILSQRIMFTSLLKRGIMFDVEIQEEELFFPFALSIVLGCCYDR
jgi:hypothetical protein